MPKIPAYLLGFAALSQAVALVAFLACQLWVQINPFGIYGNLIISLGGMVFGLIAGAGIYPGARLSGVKPGKGFAALIALVTALNVLFYHYGLYWILARDLGDYSFADFMDATAGHARMSFSRAGSGDPSDIGKGGYALLLLDMGWAAIASFIPFALLGKQAHCERCGTYFATSARREVRFDDAQALAEVLDLLPEPSSERAELVMKLPQDSGIKARKGSAMLAARRGHCPSCHEQDMTETLSLHNGEGYVEQESYSYRWRQASSRAPALPPMAQPASAAMPARGGFGRKGLS
ncbi:MAG: hypothetical protein ACKOPG_03615 [Novosphingobium sp.]